MKKTVYLIGGLAVFIFIFILIIISGFFFQPGQKNFLTGVVPSPIPIQNGQNSILKILLTEPADKQTAIPINQFITVTFSKNVLGKDISFAIQPPATYDTSVVNNQLVVSFSSNLLPTTLYTYTVYFHGNNLGSFTFTTAGATSVAQDQAALTMKNWSRANQPDMFVYTNTPYKTADFSVVADFIKTSPYNAFFNVSLLGQNKDQNKQAFLVWLTSLGLTDQQIQNLDIRYP